jgi:hypothetical protein
MSNELTMICPSCWGASSKSCGYCKGAGSVPDVQLSEHFQLSEFLRSNAASRKGIPNEPSTTIIDNLARVAGALEIVRSHFGPVMVSSGYRAPAVNAEIGGVSSSAHCFGHAVDFNVAKVAPADVIRWIGVNLPSFDQAIDEPGWAHLGLFSPEGFKQRKQLLVMRGGKYTPFKG